jgi:glycosyltransferase involved in cell wall biosynthesis
LKLYYVTRVNVPSGAAQAVQVSSMCKQFGECVENFKLVSPLNSENENLDNDFSWDKIRLNSKFPYLEFTLKSLLKAIKEKPTHIFTRDIVVAFALSFLGIQISYEAHKDPKSKVSSFLLKYLLGNNNFKLIVISNGLRDFYIREYHCKEDQIFAYHDGVFIEKYDKYRSIPKQMIRNKLGLPEERIIIMHTGSLYPGRGAELFGSIAKGFPQILLVQVGGREGDIEKYRKIYQEYENIVFVKHQKNDDLIKYQISADLLLFPMTNKTETFWCCSPMKVFEYMATGVPILSSNVGSVSEVLNDGNSTLFDSKDGNTIVAGVESFVKDRKNFSKKARVALNDVREKYTWSKRVYAIIRFIE